MTQVSANTIIYEQIFNLLRDFFVDDLQGSYLDEQERVQEFYSAITRIYRNIGMPSTEFDPFIYGEPPFSGKMNNFTQDFSRDINTLMRQTDQLNAKVVNTFNLFFSEIEREKSLINRISSKSKILQMYSKSPSNDLVYFGDSFDNMDYIDISQVKSGMIPMVRNGSLTFPIRDVNKWNPYKISLLESNGFMGNNHQVIKSSDEDQENGYKYAFLDNPSVQAISSIVDSSPLTFFEYEALNVAKFDDYYSKEFSYISDVEVVSPVEPGGLYDWSDHSQDEPLLLKLKIEARYPQMANSVDITPNFKSMDVVRLDSLLAYDGEGNYTELVSEPVYIGSSISPINIEYSKNYYYNTATIRFAETSVAYFIATLSQDSYKDIDIQHVYWKPIQGDIKTPFDGMDRFNPEAINQNEYINVSFDQNKILPSMAEVNNIKVTSSNTIGLQTYVTESGYDLSGHVIRMILVDEDENEVNAYFTGYKDYQGSNIIDFVIAEDLNSSTFTNARYSTEEDATVARDTLKTWVSDLSNSFNGSNPYEILAGDGSRYVLDISTITVDQISLNIPPRERGFLVYLQLQRELLKAKRWCVSLADFSVSHEVYSNEFEMVSLPYSYDENVESIMLSADSIDNNQFSNNLYFRYYLSLGGSNWYEISPIELSSRGVAEVFSLNQNISEENKLAGVAYLSSPEIPQAVRSVRVKITCSKSANLNATPQLNSYQLIAKVKKI